MKRNPIELKNMKLKQLTFRTQIFLASLILVTLPTTLLGAITATKNASSIVADYNSSMETILSQASLTLDTLLSDATKIADLPLLNQDIKKAMRTNYGQDYLAYSQDSTKFKNQFSQTNRLNESLISCVFLNRYGYTFEYNISSMKMSNQIMENISSWKEIARLSSNKAYFAPLQPAANDPRKKVLPMIRILYDGYDFKELGICYIEINFQSVETILASARNRENTILIYNAEDQLTYSSDPAFLNAGEKQTALLERLSQFHGRIPEKEGVYTETLSLDHKSYLVNGCYNKTTGWRLIQFTDNSIVNRLYRNNFLSYSGIFSMSLFLGLALALILSSKLSNSIKRLCHELDSLSTDQYQPVSMDACGSNQELRRLITSFNHLNRRLCESLEQNYTIRLEEQQSRIQMLQFQINHHFLYNTLNVIKSLANLHNIPEIETVSVCMSELIRYNLTTFPMALLKEEIAQINRYMAIQNIRFPGKFTFDCSIPEQFHDLKYPAFILQPLVENCIEHGFYQKENSCYISISCFLEHHLFHILVADNGQGMNDSQLEALRSSCTAQNTSRGGGHSIGIRNVHQRIQSYYGAEYGLMIESSPGQGTIIDIRLPPFV